MPINVGGGVLGLGLALTELLGDGDSDALNDGEGDEEIDAESERDGDDDIDAEGVGLAEAETEGLTEGLTLGEGEEIGPAMPIVKLHVPFGATSSPNVPGFSDAAAVKARVAIASSMSSEPEM